MGFGNSRQDPGLHLPKKMSEGLADRQGLRALFELNGETACHIAHYPGNGVDVDDGGAMDLPEELWVELIEQFLYRFPDECLALASHGPRVFRIRLEVADFIDRDHAHLAATGRIDPAQVTAALGCSLA